MPLIDMPLEDLKTYRGRNPRPDDFDEYWDFALAEMHGVDPKLDLKPSGYELPNAECFNLFFTGVGGAGIHAKYARPKNLDKPAPAIVLFHGYTWRSDDWFNLLSWTSQGFCVAAMDCRGQGGLSEDVGGVRGNTVNGHIIRGLDDAPEKLLYRSIFLDTAQLAGIVMGLPEVDSSRVGATGGSQGGGLTLACAALEPRINRAAPIYPFLCDYLRVWEMDLAAGAYAELKTHFKFFDPLHKNENEIFARLGYIDNQHLAGRIKAEVLMTVGLMDTVCPPSTQFAAYNKITSKKNLLIYPDYGHEGLFGVWDAILQFMLGM